MALVEPGLTVPDATNYVVSVTATRTEFDVIDAYATRERITRRPYRGADEFVVFRAADRYAGSKLANHPTGVRRTKRTFVRRTRRAVAQVLRADYR